MNSVLILEDHPEANRVLKEIVNEAIPSALVHSVFTIADARDLVGEVSLDLALIDISLPDGNGIEFIRELKRLCPDVSTIITTIYGDDRNLFDALRAGAQGYLLKERPKAEILEAVKGVLRGQPPLSPSISRRILSEFSRQSVDSEKVHLTAREQDVLALLTKGLAYKEIARSLNISHYTVSEYIKRVYRKLNVNSSSQAAVEAVRRGLVSLD